MVLTCASGVQNQGCIFLILIENGRLYTFGIGNNFALGVGDTLNRTAPVVINSTGATQFSSGAIGGSSAYAITGASIVTRGQTDTVDLGLPYSWGDNTFGQLCQGHTSQVMRPLLVGALWRFRLLSVAASPSGRYAFWLTSNHPILCCICNDIVQVGMPCLDAAKEVVVSSLQLLSHSLHFLWPLLEECFR